MSERQPFIASTFAELTRRKVPRTVGAYAVGVFVLLQLMDAAVEPLRLPDWLPTLVVIVLILGFPAVFLLAWQFDLTPTGIRRATSTGVLSRTQSATLFSVCLMSMLGLGYVFYEYYSGVFEAIDAPAAETRLFTAPKNSIAVLPFTDLSPSGDQAYFSDGITEEILNLLAQVDGLQVAARTSSFAFRDPKTDIREIGRLLNVSTVLEGSIRSSGNRIRLTAQLINVEDGYHIWSQTFDRELNDLFAIQDEVASHIAQALVESFTGLEQSSTAKTNNLAAANAYRTGRLHWWRRTPAELKQALGLFAEALEHDAGYAPAYAAMADTWLLLGQYGNIMPMDAIEKAQPMIEKALAIDPESAEGFAALGLARWQIGQHDAAESALRQAVELNENYIPAQLWLAGVLGQQGRYPEEHLILEKAMALDPLNELLAVNYANNQQIRGDFESARQLLSNLIELRPDSTLLLRSMAEQKISHGELVEGWKLAHRSYLLEPGNPSDLATLARTWVTLGEPDKAEELINQGLATAGENFNLLSVQWLTLLVSGRFEEAERLVREMMAHAGDQAPEPLLQAFNQQLGLIALAREDYAAARSYLESAISEEEDSPYDHDKLETLMFASLAASYTGDADAATARLLVAEKKIQRARLNGVDNPDIYYSEAALLAMRGNIPAALEKLQQAYDRGFRELWLLTLDWRLGKLRNEAGFIDLKTRLGEDIERAVGEIESFDIAGL